LFQVARNLAIDELRRRGRRDALTDAMRPRLDRPGPDLHAELEHALADLSPKLREALLLIEIAGFTYREAGELLGVREGTVKSRVFHARRQVTSWFADGDEEVTGEV
jgi:RNA polymerase sigma-70 factor (ECF subfamily)